MALFVVATVATDADGGGGGGGDGDGDGDGDLNNPMSINYSRSTHILKGMFYLFTYISLSLFLSFNLSCEINIRGLFK